MPGKEPGPQSAEASGPERMNCQGKGDLEKGVRELATTIGKRSSTPSQEDSEEEDCRTQHGRDI